MILVAAPTASAKMRSKPASESELAEIAARGRQLAEYDSASWHGTDAVLALKPDVARLGRYVARMVGGQWTVVFGRFSEKKDVFLISYEATQINGGSDYKAVSHDPPRPDTGYYLFAARAADKAFQEFRPKDRQYNVAVLPAPKDRFYVYLMPAQTRTGVYPIGADVRYLISTDGLKIVETRRLHNSIVEFTTSGSRLSVLQFTTRTAVLDNIPEDTDVFHVLARQPAVPELLITPKYVYLISQDGDVNYLMTADKYKQTKVGVVTVQQD
ncbi:MAG TPA: hypothetical protein VFY29_02035 [Terriglobia bacterium]|nr:hypothetical protein [Terriglobia bacterium]